MTVRFTPQPGRTAPSLPPAPTAKRRTCNAVPSLFWHRPDYSARRPDGRHAPSLQLPHGDVPLLPGDRRKRPQLARMGRGAGTAAGGTACGGGHGKAFAFPGTLLPSATCGMIATVPAWDEHRRLSSPTGTGRGRNARTCGSKIRGTAVSRALALGEDLTMIGKLLGHKKIQSTARNAHLARDSVKGSAALVAASIGGRCPVLRESLNNPVSEASRGRGGLDLRLDDIADRPGAALVTGSKERTGDIRVDPRLSDIVCK